MDTPADSIDYMAVLRDLEAPIRGEHVRPHLVFRQVVRWPTASR